MGGGVSRFREGGGVGGDELEPELSSAIEAEAEVRGTPSCTESRVGCPGSAKFGRFG